MAFLSQSVNQMAVANIANVNPVMYIYTPYTHREKEKGRNQKTGICITAGGYSITSITICRTEYSSPLRRTRYAILSSPMLFTLHLSSSLITVSDFHRYLCRCLCHSLMPVYRACVLLCHGHWLEAPDANLDADRGIKFGAGRGCRMYCSRTWHER